jgi:2-oxoglutarate dehydrogenase E1 component
MAGLGIVPEAMQMSELEAYWIGGSVHVVLNNQIGFTTLPQVRLPGFCDRVFACVECPCANVGSLAACTSFKRC